MYGEFKGLGRKQLSHILGLCGGGGVYCGICLGFLGYTTWFETDIYWLNLEASYQCTDWIRAERPRCNSQQGQTFFLLATGSRWAASGRSTASDDNWEFCAVRWPEDEIDHSPTPTGEIENMWSNTFILPHVCRVWPAWPREQLHLPSSWSWSALFIISNMQTKHF
jgi:hypothetical protein